MIWRKHIHKVVLHLPDSWSNWNLEMLVSEESTRTRVPGEKPLGARERTINKLNPHMALTTRFEPGHIGGRQAISPLRHPLLSKLINDNGDTACHANMDSAAAFRFSTMIEMLKTSYLGLHL